MSVQGSTNPNQQRKQWDEELEKLSEKQKQWDGHSPAV